jgi:hypothetical protein
MKRRLLEIATELHQMFWQKTHPGYPARKSGHLDEKTWIEMGERLTALTSPAPEKPAEGEEGA